MKPLSTLSVMLLGTIVATPATAERYERQPGIIVDHYVFNVEVAEGSHEIEGETVTTVRFVDSGVAHVFFDLQARRTDGTGMTVSAVTEDGAAAPLRFDQKDERVTIQLAKPPSAGEVRTFRIRYAGAPSDGLLFGTSRSGQRGAFSWNWPTKMRNWVPVIDHISSKVTSEFVVTAPEAYTVVANGLLHSEVALGDGRKVTHWKQGVPIAPWLNALGIGRLQTYYGGSARGVPLQIWAPPGNKVDVANGFLVARRTIDLFGDLVGPYPYEKLGQVMAPLGGGGMEHASVIFYGDGGTRDGSEPHPERGNAPGMSRDGLLAHEIAHQWFGDSVTEATWGDVWLSEAFATYFSDLYTEHYKGRDAFVAGLRSERTGALAAEKRERDPVITSADENAGPDLSRVQYVKGAWVLHMLRQQVTTPVFFDAIRRYYDRHKGGHATTADFRRAMEEASGQKLGWFFDQWLTRVDSPRLDMRWSYDEQAKTVRLTVTQAQTGDAYRLPVEVGVAAEPRGALSVTKFDMTQKTQMFTIPADAAPADVVLDPNVNLLADMTIGKQ